MGYPPDEPLLGRVLGGAAERAHRWPSRRFTPTRSYIFKEPLEEMCVTREELEEEIEITVVHEVAHFLGMSEERLAELGYE
ncbi:MAG: metallopeptidase family protein [Desulfobacterales bacterium]|nr:metallopeptidase family protein [Desulfobacterales bacterium]